MFGDHEQSYNDVYNNDNQHDGSLTHELLAGGASFYAVSTIELILNQIDLRLQNLNIFKVLNSFTNI